RKTDDEDWGTLALCPRHPRVGRLPQQFFHVVRDAPKKKFEAAARSSRACFSEKSPFNSVPFSGGGGRAVDSL
ncbi:MAG: hypothetical protein WD403_14935, partial [Pirellulales bacterium]